ncbi:N-acetyltransferase [Rhizobium leguminosarum]|uniref:GNAT family N-acetyltransferase n=1 Tax=Rhizobium leguminosarum TaxID=384 RepID=UPI0010300B52|nr:GNAT family N-acetyltransferase [Rhizobium leguminosarum]TAU34909.1 N-acetyltransferase [Rhizobium leguminosarum]
MQASQIDLVDFRPEHLEAAVNLSRQAGWPHRPEDWQMALAVSSGVVAVEDERRVVGTVLVTSYGKDCATINMVIVDETMRGRGLGRKLMDAALVIAGNRQLRLIATSDGLPLYQKLGFREIGSVLQHQGHVPTVAAPDNVESAQETDFETIAALDRAAFGADRQNLLDYIATVGRFAVIRRAGQVHGFAALRAFGRGEVIGPVVAANSDDARTLISFFMASRPGAFLRVDTTADVGISPWLATHGLAHVGGGVAMRTASVEAATLREPKTFALANQALG